MCPGIPNAFTLDTSTSTLGLVDSFCTFDYIGIPSNLVSLFAEMGLKVQGFFIVSGSNSVCSNTGNTLSSKYCGSYLGMGTAAGGIAAISQSICGRNEAIFT